MKNTIQIVALSLAGMAAAQSPNGTSIVVPHSSWTAPSSWSAQSSVSFIPTGWTAPISSKPSATIISPMYPNATTITTVVDVFVTLCTEATTFTINNECYTATTPGQYVTVTDCGCTVESVCSTPYTPATTPATAPVTATGCLATPGVTHSAGLTWAHNVTWASGTTWAGSKTWAAGTTWGPASAAASASAAAAAAASASAKASAFADPPAFADPSAAASAGASPSGTSRPIVEAGASENVVTIVTGLLAFVPLMFVFVL